MSIYDKCPDDPRITLAELHGEESTAPVFCRLCGKECTTIFVSAEDHEPVGCDRCIYEIDAYEWEGRD